MAPSQNLILQKWTLKFHFTKIDPFNFMKTDIMKSEPAQKLIFFYDTFSQFQFILIHFTKYSII